MPLDAATDDAAKTLAAQPPARAAASALGTSYGPGMVANTVNDIRQTTAQKEQALAPIYQQIKDDYAAGRSKLSEAEKNYQPVEPLKTPPPVPPNDPLAGFGSIASIFGAIASMRTGTPAINAMNAMAGAVNATKTGDWEQYRAHYDQWKENTELALRHHRQQQEDLRLALDMLKENVAAGHAMLKTYGAQYDDKIATTLTEQGQYEKLAEVQLQRGRLGLEMANHALRVKEMNERLLLNQPIADATKSLIAARKSGDPAAIAAARDDYSQTKAMMNGTARPGSRESQFLTLFNDAKAHGATDAEATIKATQELAQASSRSSEFDKPVLAQVTNADGTNTTVLVQQDKHSGQWVTADETRTPVNGVKQITKSGDQAADPAQVESVAKQIANYQLAPLSGFVLKSPFGQAVMAKIAELNPEYQATEYGARGKAMRDFSTGKQGQAINSFNVAISHLDTLGDLAKALENNDTQAVNRLGNYFSQQTGAPAVTNFNAAKQIVGQEIIKAIIAGGGTGAERQQAEEVLSAAQSPAQLAGVIDTYKSLMGGQLGGLKQQYEQTTGLKDFEDRLSPEARRQLMRGGSEASYGSAEDVKQAYQNGKLTKDQATKVLRDKFGYH